MATYDPFAPPTLAANNALAPVMARPNFQRLQGMRHTLQGWRGMGGPVGDWHNPPVMTPGGGTGAPIQARGPTMGMPIIPGQNINNGPVMTGGPILGSGPTSLTPIVPGQGQAPPPGYAAPMGWRARSY